MVEPANGHERVIGRMERPGNPGTSSEEEPVETQRDGAPTAEQSLRASNLLLHALTEVQTEFIQGHDTHQLFDKLLSVLLKLTHSEYGFIGEVLFTPEGTPFLRTRAVAHVEWTDALREFYRRELSTGLEFSHLQKLFGAVMVSGRPVLDNAPCREEFGTRLEGHPPLSSFLGLPFHSPTEMVGMVGLANRPGGFDTGVITFLRPVLATCCAILQGLRNEQRRRRAEDAQRRSAESFRLLIERSPDAIFIHRQGTLLFANSAAVRLLGYTSGEQLRGRELETFVLSGGEVMLRESPGSSGLLEVRFRHRQGHEVVGEVVTLSLVFDGRPAEVCIARDMTERRQVQQKLRATERMVSLGTLAAGVAHEINNPLSYLLSNLHFVDDELSAMAEAGEPLGSARGGELREALKEALSGSHRVRDIVRDLKTFSRDTEDQRGWVDVRGVLDSCVNIAWSEIRHRARLEKDYGEVPLVEANESRLAQIFLNLLVNAAQAIPHGDVRANEIRISTHHEGEQVVVAVRDTGGGISEENLRRLFEPFFTTKPVGVGTGLGLSICHGIVTGMGGRITVDSTLGQGTTFRVFLPIKRPAGVSA
ncbi:ATP-binding protein [Cystobacter fuscus]|uniref:ATP-binding protein n=1 Tax=Cystobacter fuscus TaxID=43 RepID=UPI002B2F961C|nr:PAS domain S-box protein [Cystobacter fuscus]